MALNPSGPISLGGSTAGESINLELGSPATTTVSLNQTEVRALAGVPSGLIVMPLDFWGKSSSSQWIGSISGSTPSTFWNASIAEDTTTNDYYFLANGSNTIYKIQNNGNVVWVNSYSPFTLLNYLAVDSTQSLLYVQGNTQITPTKNLPNIMKLNAPNGSYINSVSIDALSASPTAPTVMAGIILTPSNYVQTAIRYTSLPAPSITSKYLTLDNNLNLVNSKAGSSSSHSLSSYVSRFGNSYIAYRNAPLGTMGIAVFEPTGNMPGTALTTNAPTTATKWLANNPVTNYMVYSQLANIQAMDSSNNFIWVINSLSFNGTRTWWDTVNNKILTYQNNYAQLAILNGTTGVQEKNYLMTSSAGFVNSWQAFTLNNNVIIFAIYAASTNFILKLDATTYISAFDATFTATVGGYTLTITPYPSGNPSALLMPSPVPMSALGTFSNTMGAASGFSSSSTSVTTSPTTSGLTVTNI